jgi:hypothetical protein
MGGEPAKVYRSDRGAGRSQSLEGETPVTPVRGRGSRPGQAPAAMAAFVLAKATEAVSAAPK